MNSKPILWKNSEVSIRIRIATCSRSIGTLLHAALLVFILIYLALQLVGKGTFQLARQVFSTGWRQIFGCAALLLALAFPHTGWAQPSLCGVWMPQTAANWDFSVLVRPDGKLYAWGNNTYGQLGIGAASVPHLSPVAVATGAVPAGTCFVQVSAGNYYTVALAANGRLFAWGSNARFGQLGNGSDSNIAAPVAVVPGAAPAGTRFVQVSAAAFHTVALAADSTLYAWGEAGQLGDSTFIDRFAPVAVRLSPKIAGTRFTQVATGLNQTVAIAADGSLYAWRNGPTQSATPKAVPLGAAPVGTRFIQVSTGSDYALALAADGRVYAWGNNGNGQLGKGATGQRSLTRWSMSPNRCP